MKLKTVLFTAFLAVMSLTACSSTYEGLKNDFKYISNKVYGEEGLIKTQDQQGVKQEVVTTTDSTVNDHIIVQNSMMDCPTLILDPRLKSATEFYDMKSPSEETEISTISITETKTRCNEEADNISMEIDITFEGQLGSYAEGKDSGKLFFAYPYFVSVADESSTELAKEVFAVSVNYETDTTTFRTTETIKQLLPVDENGDLPAYEVQLGFQLTEEQLFYNAAH